MYTVTCRKFKYLLKLLKEDHAMSAICVWDVL